MTQPELTPTSAVQQPPTLRPGGRRWGVALGIVAIMVGLVVIAPVYTAEVASGRLIVPEAGSALAIAYVSIFPSFLAYLFFNRGVELIGSAATAQYMNVMPLMGAGLAMLFLGETLHLFHVAGLALVVAGIWIAGRPTTN